MRVIRFVAALSLAAGFALSAGDAQAQENDNPRLFGEFDLEDTKCNDPNTDNPTDIENRGTVVLGELPEEEQAFFTEGESNGVGTQGDDVAIEYFTDLPSSGSATDKKGSANQTSFAEICITIESEDPNGPRNYENCFNPEKCSVKGSYQEHGSGDSNTENDGFSGNISVNCSSTTLFSELSNDQVSSIQAAFPTNNKCGVKFTPKPSGQKSTITINLKNKKQSFSE